MDRVIKLIKASKGDAKQVFESWGCNRSNFRYLSTPPQISVSDAQKYLERIMENPADPVFHIVTDTTVGLIKAKLDGHRALVGYVIDEPFWGQGIATAALRQMVYLLRENSKIQRIWATCATDNPGSSAVLEKCGFIREGILRNWIVYPAQGPEPQDNFSYYLPNNI